MSSGKEAGAKGISGHIVSIDALRGFDMFWIMGADHILTGLGKVSDSPTAKFFGEQLEHKSWEGFAFYDLIFPLFVFLLGMGIVFSLGKIIAREGLLGAHKRIFRRFILLFLLGAFYDDGLSNMAHESPFSGVMQRLAWCYLFTSLLYCHLKPRGLIVAFVALLIGYWALLSFVPPPGSDSVDLMSRNGPNIVIYVDEHYLPFKEEGQRWDPEGLVSTLGAFSSCLIGVFAAFFLTSTAYEDKRKMTIFAGVGVLMVITGFLWGWQMPVVKRLWTPSYVLVAGGYSCLLVAFFYTVIDIYKMQKWATPFIWIGVNPLTLYIVSSFVDYHDLGARLAGGPIAGLFGQYGSLLTALVGLGICVMFARFLYQRKIFLRV